MSALLGTSTPMLHGRCPLDPMHCPHAPETRKLFGLVICRMIMVSNPGHKAPESASLSGEDNGKKLP